MPSPEDHCCERNEPSSIGDVLVESTNDADRPPCPTDACDGSGKQQVSVTQFVDVHTECSGGLGVFADCARPQAPLGAVQAPGGKGHCSKREVHEDGLHEEDRPEERDVGQQRDSNRRHRQQVVHRVAVGHQHAETDERSDSQRKEVDGKSDDDLVDFVANRHDGEDGGKSHPGQHTNEGSQPQVGERRTDGARAGGSQQHSFDRDIDDTTALAENSADGTKRDGHASAHRVLQHANETERITGCSPRQETHEERCGGKRQHHVGETAETTKELCRSHCNQHDAQCPTKPLRRQRELVGFRDPETGITRTSRKDKEAHHRQHEVGDADTAGSLALLGRHHALGHCCCGHPPHPLNVWPNALASPFTRKIAFTSSGAAMNITMSARNTMMRSMGTSVSTCI